MVFIIFYYNLSTQLTYLSNISKIKSQIMLIISNGIAIRATGPIRIIAMKKSNINLFISHLLLSIDNLFFPIAVIFRRFVCCSYKMLGFFVIGNTLIPTNRTVTTAMFIIQIAKNINSPNTT